MHHAPGSSTTMKTRRHLGNRSPSVMKTLSQLSSDRCTRALEVPVGESGVLQGSLSVRRLGLPSLQHAKPYLPALLTRSNARALLSLTEGSLGAPEKQK